MQQKIIVNIQIVKNCILSIKCLAQNNNDF